jgi:hypothetical protein
MNKLHVGVLGIAVALCCSPAVAQHGPTGNTTGHTGGGNGHVLKTSAHRNSTTSHKMTVDQQLSRNTKLAGKIQTLTGMNAQDACSGFKNLGQCVAAAHVSKNLGISFDCLKSDMTGQAPASNSTCPASTGTKAMSLGKSIQTLSPNSNSKTESKKAQAQADQDVKSRS